MPIKYLFNFPPHPTSASALPGDSRLSTIRVKVDEKTSINFIYPDLWALTASLLQCLTGKVWIGLEQNIIDTAVNKWIKRFHACVRIIN